VTPHRPWSIQDIAGEVEDRRRIAANEPWIPCRYLFHRATNCFEQYSALQTEALQRNQGAPA